MFVERFVGVVRTIPWCFKEVSRNFKGFSRMIEGCFKGV